MNITLSVVIMLVAYTFGAISKIFIDTLPNKYIPIQNVIIGLLSGILCFILGINTSILESILMGIMSTMSAGGLSDLINVKETVKS